MGAELMPTIEKIRERLTTVERIIVVTPDGVDDEYEEWLANATPVSRQADVTPETPAWSCTPPAPQAAPRA